jgi:hypothetical protein
MVLTNKINISTPFFVTAFSLIIIIFVCSQNNLVFGQSVNVLKNYDEWGKYFFTQDDSKSTQDNSKNNLNSPSSDLDKKSESTDQSSSSPFDEGQASQSSSSPLDEGQASQSSSSPLDEEQTNNNTSQSSSSPLDEEQTHNNTSQSSSSPLDEEQTNNNTSQSVATNQVQNNNQSQVQNNNQNMNMTNQIETQQRLESIIIEREGEKPIPLEEQKKIESEDVIVIREHKSLTGPNCRTGHVLNGASNEKDLRVLSECQQAVGVVKHTKKMGDGDYKFLLDLDNKYDFLLNEKNNQKTDGLLVVEIVPKDQNVADVFLPKAGDRVDIWGAWVTDKPKGWHEIHPTWKVDND